MYAVKVCLFCVSLRLRDYGLLKLITRVVVGNDPQNWLDKQFGHHVTEFEAMETATAAPRNEHER